MVFRAVGFCMMAFMLGLLVLSGCNRLGESEPTRIVPTSTSTTMQTQTVTLPTLTEIISPENVYPSPVTVTAVTPTQDAAAYPLPLETTLPAISLTPAPILTQSENIIGNPYPLQETPLPQQVGASNLPPYPPPAEAPALVGSTNAAPSYVPTEISPATPVPQNTVVPSGTSIFTPQANIVKTRFVATDPRTVNLEAGRPQMVVLYADWCTLCKSLAPVILGLEGKYNDRMNFIYLNVDDAGTEFLQKKFNYRLIARPRTFLIDGMGVILRDWTGYTALEELQQAIDSVVPATVVPATIAPVSP
jgi:thiol-disulfide isomerase/thioredoxin